MRARWVPLAGLVASVAATGEAQPRSPSIAFTVMAVASDPVFVGGGLALAVPVTGVVRLRPTGLVGGRGGETEVRGECLVEFVPGDRSRGWSPFGGVGVSVVAGPDRDTQGRMTIVAGLEQRPGSGRGWRLEAGVGGGARLGVAYRVPL